ncbi:MAG: type II secretion system protein [Planctomycetota bacterium]
MELRLRSRRRGFALVELLVVIAVIGLLMAILIPALTQVRNSARQASCASNLREITRAMLAYASASNLHRGTVPNALPSVGPTTSNWDDLEEGNPATFWLLLTGKQPGDDDMDQVRRAWIQPGVLLCPGAQQAGAAAPELSDAGMQKKTYSYSYLSQVPFDQGGRTITGTSVAEAPGSLAILADRNPACEVGEQTFNSSEADNNAPNHGRRGQNVASVDQSVRWVGTPTVSGPEPGADEDNIYAPSSGSGSSGERANMADSFLIP